MIKHLPWTEKFRPRSLDDVILSKSAKANISNWWRCWVALWNLRILRNIKYSSSWFDFIWEPEGRKFWQKYKKTWREYFLKEFEKWIKNTSTQSKIFVSDSMADIKSASRPLMDKWLERTWSNFLLKEKIEEKDIPIPPLPPYKPLLLVGPPGCGKTTTAYALANDEGVIVIEFNASDERSKSKINSIVKETAKSGGFFIKTVFPQKPPRIILFDEVDGMSSHKDKGGFEALLKLLEEIVIPPILTANVIHDLKVRRLMANCVTVFYDRPRDYEAKKLIAMIAKRVNMTIPDDIVKKIINYAPDFRSIIVALETYYYSGKLPNLWHDRMSSVQDAIRLAFGKKSRTGDLNDTINLSKRYLQESGEDIAYLMLISWDNAWNFIDREHLYGFFRAVADADYYYRIGARKNNWRVAYLNSINLLSYAMAKYGKPSNIWKLRRIRVNIPKIGTQFQKLYNVIRGTTSLGRLVLRLSSYLHISRRRTLQMMNLIIFLAKNKPEKVGALFAQIGCDEESVDAFINEYIKDKKIKKSLMGSYQKTLQEISIRSLATKTKKVEKGEERQKREKKAETKERHDKRKGTAKVGTLDYFLK